MSKLYDDFLEAIKDKTKTVAEITKLLENKELLKILNEEEKIKEALLEAIDRGDAVIFQKLFDLPSAQPLKKNAYGKDMLHMAAEEGSEGIVQILIAVPEILKYELDTIERSDQFQAMTRAAWHGHLKVVEIFLAIPKVVERLNKSKNYRNGYEPFIGAAQKGHLNVVNRLLELLDLLPVYQIDHLRINEAFRAAISKYKFDVARRLMRLPAIRDGAAALERLVLRNAAIHGEWLIVDSLMQIKGVLRLTELSKIFERPGADLPTLVSHHEALQGAMAAQQYEVAYRMVQYYRRASVPLPSEIRFPKHSDPSNTNPTLGMLGFDLIDFRDLIDISHFAGFPAGSSYGNFDRFQVEFVGQLQDIENSLNDVFKIGNAKGFTNIILKFCGFNLPLPPFPPTTSLWAANDLSVNDHQVDNPVDLKTKKDVVTKDFTTTDVARMGIARASDPAPANYLPLRVVTMQRSQPLSLVATAASTVSTVSTASAANAVAGVASAENVATTANVANTASTASTATTAANIAFSASPQIKKLG